MSSFPENSAPASLKKFVSEAEIEEKRKKRQEEWEKVRQPHQPLEAPEEVVDPRSLYEQLQANKEAKQLEYEEQHRMKNQVHGLDEEEADFLSYVNQRHQDLEKERHLEEVEVLQEFRNSLTGQTTSVESASKPAERTNDTKVHAGKKRSSQAELLSGAVKKKRVDSGSQKVDETKKPADSSSDSASEESGIAMATSKGAREDSPDDDDDDVAIETAGVARVVGVLPGLGVYTDSENSDTSSSDSEIDTDLFRHEAATKTTQEAAAAAAHAARKRR